MSRSSHQRPPVSASGLNVQLTDTKSQHVRVQAHPDDVITIECEHGPYEQARISSGKGRPWDPQPHLNVHQAVAVRDALDVFVRACAPVRLETPAVYDTARGFHGYAQLTDVTGQRVRVQLSSSATDDAVWIFCDRPQDEPKEGDGSGSAAARLNAQQAAVVHDALTAFIEDHSIRIVLTAAQVRALEDAIARFGDDWIERDEDYGYLGESALAPLRERITSAGSEGLLLSDQETFVLRRLYEYLTSVSLASNEFAAVEAQLSR
jgi:hypothetical protein